MCHLVCHLVCHPSCHPPGSILGVLEPTFYSPRECDVFLPLWKTLEEGVPGSKKGVAPVAIMKKKLKGSVCVDLTAKHTKWLLKQIQDLRNSKTDEVGAGRR